MGSSTPDNFKKSDGLATTNRSPVYESALVSFAQGLLRDEADLDTALASLALAAQVETIYVERNFTDPHLGAASEIVSYLDPGLGADATIWDTYLWAELPAVFKALSEGRPWSMEESLLLPAGPERDHYSTTIPRVVSELAIPIMVDEQFAGCIAFVSLSEPRHWDDDEIDLLVTAAEMIAMVWTRKSQEKLLTELSEKRAFALRMQTALLECSQALLRGADDTALSRSLETMRRATNTSLVYIDVNVEDPVRGACYEPKYFATRPGLELDLEPYSQRFEWSDIPDTLESMLAREIWATDPSKPLPVSERDFMDAFSNIVSAEMVAPIYVGDEWVAVAGLVDDRVRPWSAEERRMLEAVAGMFGSYWQLERSEQEKTDLLSAKDRFVASISHELRTPLSAVVGYTAELRDRAEDFDPEEQHEMVGLISEQASEVSHIVNDLLVAARAETAQVNISFENVDLVDCLDGAMKTIPPSIRDAISVRSQIGAFVRADGGRLRQVIRNLLTNAHRYGGGRILVDILERDGFGVVRVSDTGPPIPEDQREAIFEAYKSLGTQAGLLPSIGLGLTVSRQLARLMGGDIEYSHTGESAFEVTIPTV